MYLEHLMYINTNSETRAGSYKLMRDLDFQDSSNYLNLLNKIAWTTGSGWNPIGYIHDNSVVGFTGNFNGNNKKIKNLYINKPLMNNLGLFGVIKPNANISNLILENVNITGQNYVSGLVSDNGGNISNCQVSGLVNSPSINTSNYVIGGLAGLNYGTITNCIFSGYVSGVDDVGGFIGNLDLWSGAYDSRAAGNVIGERIVGGFVGRSEQGSIRRSFSTGNVSGSSEYIGGFIGSISGTSNITENYSTGNVINTGGFSVGGFAGGANSVNPGLESYWDMNTSGTTTSAFGIGKTTTEMKTQGTFTDWNFTDIWEIDSTINNGYPYLQDNSPQ